MGTKFDDILSQKAFDSLELEQKEAFKKLALRLEGKNSTESVGIMMEFMKSMPKGKPLQPAEKSAMITAMLQSMPESDQVKFQSLMKMMGM